MENKQTSSGRITPKFQGTDVTNLSVELNSGIFYLLASIGGKYHRESLKTTSKSAAKELLTKRLAEIRESAAKGLDTKSDLTIKVCADAWLSEQKALQAAGSLTPNYIGSLEYCFKVLWKVFPANFGDLAIRKVTVEVLKTPYLKFLATGGSATRINTVRRCLIGIFGVAIERKVVTENLASNLPHKVKQDKERAWPNDDQLVSLFNHIVRTENRNSWKFPARDFLEFLCWTGARRDEAANVLVRDVRLDGDAPEIALRICKGSGGTESRARTVPVIPGARALLAKLCEGKAPDAPLLEVTNCLETLQDACADLGLPKYNHHTFRHVFATRALEATGCDYFTVANWLGHTDGGKLLGKLYAHLNTKHSQAQAKKIDFGFNAGKKPAAKVKVQTVLVNGTAYTLDQLAALLPNKLVAA